MINENFILKDSGYSNYVDTTALARHRWYYYKEGFSPNLVEKAIQETEISSTDLIIDPFNGSGTTTLTSAIKGYNSIGIEVNPFTAFLSETKSKNTNIKELNKFGDKLLSAAEKGKKSPLIGFSTFSERDGIDKWLFNNSVLNSFEGAWQFADSASIYNTNLKRITKLALISAAMQNCNAVRDGKCLRYRPTWSLNGFNRDSFTAALSNILSNIKEDIENNPINTSSLIINGDSRKVLSTNNAINKFKLCITSPPYLNTFDYTDIYRPELFLGKFVTDAPSLYNLRLTTVRSHIQAKWKEPKQNDFGLLYTQAINHLNDNKEKLMHKSIPMMVQAYFEDMLDILKLLKSKAAKDAQIWFVVSNSAYAGHEVPVDLIIGEIALKAGWYLKEVGVLRYLKKRKTKHSPEVVQLRESVVILTNSKF